MEQFSKILTLEEMKSFDSEILRQLILFSMLLLFNVVIFGQDASHLTDDKTLNIIVMPSQIITETSSSDTTTESKMDLVFWVVGFKQSLTTNGTKNSNNENNISTNSSVKKSFINAGMSTKSVLYRTFFKKIINYKNTTV
jgi:hypothetical protein